MISPKELQPIPTIPAPSPNIVTWLELEALKVGATHQRERWEAGLLPEDELTALVRPVLFKPFEGMAAQDDSHGPWRWATNRARERMVRDLKHGRGCTHVDVVEFPGRIKFETLAVAELNPQEWKRLKLIQASAELAQQHPWLVKSGGKVTVETATHWATCSQCEGETCKSSAKVCIEWATRLLTREYSL